ncbi:YihY/virulence factor BrkB family protein [Halopseudomonas formosensis]|uniref:YihY/virulence factor BrkB family protein n=1 Tax=Halopseudomonas formosensis TaxID=1002526 RepID=A0ABU5BZV6_9GAMM|nr:YihY/virulence factor BrkB family protein [Halopseudomonas formosensis]MDX9688297.1 YihY/virulence factor BrkB family protein [Halopseudomonas formosensis]
MSFLQLRDAGVWDVIKRTAKGFSEHDLSTYAAALAYRALFSIFPFILFLLALLGFLHLPDFFDWLRSQADLLLPPVAMEQVGPVIDQLQDSQGGLMSFGILLALWTASIGVRSLMNAMNRVYAVEESRPSWKLVLLSVAYTVGLAVMLLLAAGFMTLGPQVMSWLASQIGMEQMLVTLWTWIRWPLAILLMMLAVALIYYATPDVEQDFRFITPGSVVAVIVWLAASIGFGIYVQNFGNYNATYGSIGAIIVLLLYFYISAAVLLLGAQLNATIEHASAEGKDVGDKQLED